MSGDRQTFVRGMRNFKPQPRGCVVTIGAFDGVHLGHQRLLTRVKQLSQQLQLPSVVMIFEPLPREYFLLHQAPARLMRVREKVEALLAEGVDKVLCLRFNAGLRGLSADQFVQQILLDGLNVKHIVVGDDFRFGSNREGDFDALVKIGAEKGFAVEDSPTLVIDGERVSSSRIRELLDAGDFAAAERMLSRPYAITGRVSVGQQLGTQLGIPTANLNLKRNRAPLSGVFVVEAEVGGVWYQGAANVGARPTIGDLVVPVLEVHLLDFSGDIYRQQMRVVFRHKLREEQKFATLDELVVAIKHDISQARAWFAENR